MENVIKINLLKEAFNQAQHTSSWCCTWLSTGPTLPLPWYWVMDSRWTQTLHVLNFHFA